MIALEEVFSYHVLNRAEPPFELEKYSALQMLSGQWLSIDYQSGQVGDAKLTGEVIPCSNGVIYMIDQVLTPKTDDLYQALQKDGRFSIFTKAITASRQENLCQNVHENYTVFAPTNDAWDEGEYRKLVDNPTGKNREAIFALLERHVITGKHVSENPIPYQKLRTIHGAPIYLTVEDKTTNIQGISIIEFDGEAFNGLVNVIEDVIADPMELPERDLTKVDGIRFAQQALTDASTLYDEGKYEASWRLYARRGYELADKYGQFFDASSLISKVKLSVDPVNEFADNAWDSRNAFRSALRELESKQDVIEDLLELGGDESAEFGR